MTTKNQEKISRIKERLQQLYTAEKNALEMQSTSNAEGEQSAYASLATIQKAIKDLEAELESLTSEANENVAMFWEFD